MSNSTLDIYKTIAEASGAGIKAASKITRASNKGVSVPLAAPSVKPANPVGTALDKNYAAQSQNALDKYNTAQKELEESRVRAKKEASFDNTKLMKYMPSILKRQGLSGLGVSQSAVIAANNNYGRQLTDIENDFQKNSADLLQNYNDAKLAYDTQYNTQKAQLEQAEIDKQEAAKEKAEQKTAAEQSSNFENAWEIISADTTSTDFSELLASYQGKVSEADYNTLVQLAAAQVAKNQAAKEEKSEADLKEEKSEAKAEALALMDLYLASEEYEKGLEYLESQKEILSESVYNAWKGYFEAELGKTEKSLDPDTLTDPNNPNYNQQGGAYDDLTQEEKDERIVQGLDDIASGGRDYKITSDALSADSYYMKNPEFLAKLAAEGIDPSDTNLNAKQPQNGMVVEFRGDKEGYMPGSFYGLVEAYESGELDLSGHNVNNYRKYTNKSYTAVYYNGNWYLAEDQGETEQIATASTPKSDPLGVYAPFATPKTYQGGNVVSSIFDKYKQ